MGTRAMGVGAGWHWLVRAANLGSANPGAIFGGAALLLVVTVVLAVLLLMVVGATFAGAMSSGGMSMPTMLAINLIPMLPVLFVMACFLVGYLRLVDAVESGRAASAFDVFAGFRQLPVALRVFGLMVVLAIVQNVVMSLLVSTLAPELATLYLQSLQNPMGEPPAMAEPPDGMFTLLGIAWLMGMLFFAVQAVGFGEIAIRGRGLMPALGTGFSGAVRNLLPLLLLMLICIALAIVAVVVVFVLALLVGLLVKLVGVWIGFVIGIPVYLAAVLVMVVVAFGVMYFMWRDIAGDASAAAAPRADSGDQLEL